MPQSLRHQYFPLDPNSAVRGKEYCIERAREWLSKDATVTIGIYRLVAIVRAHAEITIEVVDDDK